MNIASTQYNLNHEALEIYLAGCDGKCGDICHNKELWDFTMGIHYKCEMSKLKTKVKNNDCLINNLWVLGGEPLLQDKTSLIEMIKDLQETGKRVWLWTRFSKEDIPKEILDLLDYVKVGEYKEELKTDSNIQYGIKLATSNQKIIKL